MSYQPQQPHQHYQQEAIHGMDTLHSPPSSPQQGSGPIPEYIPMNEYPQQPHAGHRSTLNTDGNGNYLVSPLPASPQPASPQPHVVNSTYIHPSALPSPGLPPPGTEPPYTSAPNSPGFPPGPYNQPVTQPKPQTITQPTLLHTHAPYDHSTTNIVPKTPIYTPSSLTGPNGHGVHAPGQIGHPNQQLTKETYKHGFCNCFGDMGSCCLGYWCPCILYSRTYHRIKTIPESNLNAFTACNSHCAIFCVLSPVSWVFTWLQRSRIRENYRLQGNAADDCGKSYCCPVCTLVQDEREVREREDERRRFAGPGSGTVGDAGYKKSDTMVYGKK